MRGTDGGLTIVAAPGVWAVNIDVATWNVEREVDYS